MKNRRLLIFFACCFCAISLVHGQSSTPKPCPSPGPGPDPRNEGYYLACKSAYEAESAGAGVDEAAIDVTAIVQPAASDPLPAYKKWLAGIQQSCPSLHAKASAWLAYRQNPDQQLKFLHGILKAVQDRGTCQ
jgi:hypothetical protein